MTSSGNRSSAAPATDAAGGSSGRAAKSLPSEEHRHGSGIDRARADRRPGAAPRHKQRREDPPQHRRHMRADAHGPRERKHRPTKTSLHWMPVSAGPGWPVGWWPRAAPPGPGAHRRTPPGAVAAERGAWRDRGRSLLGSPSQGAMGAAVPGIGGRSGRDIALDGSQAAGITAGQVMDAGRQPPTVRRHRGREHGDFPVGAQRLPTPASARPTAAYPPDAEDPPPPGGFSPTVAHTGNGPTHSVIPDTVNALAPGATRTTGAPCSAAADLSTTLIPDLSGLDLPLASWAPPWNRDWAREFRRDPTRGAHPYGCDHPPPFRTRRACPSRPRGSRRSTPSTRSSCRRTPECCSGTYMATYPPFSRLRLLGREPSPARAGRARGRSATVSCLGSGAPACVRQQASAAGLSACCRVSRQT